MKNKQKEKNKCLTGSSDTVRSLTTFFVDTLTQYYLRLSLEGGGGGTHFRVYSIKSF